MSIISKRGFLKFFEDKRFASLWEDVENSSGRRFDSVKDLLHALLDCVDKQEGLIHDTECDPSEMQNPYADQLEQKSKMLQELEREVERQTVTNHEITRNLIEVFDLTERAAFDRHLSTEKLLDSIQSAIKAALNSSKVQIVEDVGVPFNPERHQAVSVTYTDDPGLNEHIAECIRVGIVRNGSCIRAEEVVIYKSRV